jgi:diguanylate cyclase (GGDEF)-like protein
MARRYAYWSNWLTGHCVALLLLLPLLAVAGNDQAPTLRISSDDFQQRLAEGIAWLEDKAGAATLDDVRAASARGEFSSFGSDSLQFGYSNSAYWFRFYIENARDAAADDGGGRVFIAVRYPLLDDVQLYVVRNNRTESMALGDARNYFERVFLLNDLIFPLTLAPHERVEVYLRVHSVNSVSIPIYVGTERRFVQSQSAIESFNGIYIGICVGLLIYNMFLWIGVRKRIYGIYVLFMATYLLFNLSMMGYTFRLWPDALGFQQVAIFVFSVLSGCTVVWFGIAFLQTREHLPRIHRLLCAYLLLAGIAAPAIVFMHAATAASLNALIVTGGIAILLTAAILRLRQGYRPAIYYLIGQGAVMSGIIFTVLTSRGLLPNYYMAPEVLKWGSAFEVLFFSIGLADLLNEERRLREMAQKKSEEAQKELLRVQIQLNEELDRKVRERTRALESANSKLQLLSTTDELTQLHNRRYANEMIDAEYRRAQREKAWLSVLMVDIDHFKQINDTHGHPAGDACLVHAAEIITEHTRRPPDVAARYGGEEFVILLPNTDADGARTVAGKLLDAFNARAVQHGGLSLTISVSIGIASLVPQAPGGHERLLAEADRQLYIAKQAGRNRFACSGTAA